MVIAGRNGQYVPMTPKRLPFCGSRHEAHERTQLLLGGDEEFRAKWDGWTFYMVTLEDAVVNRREVRGVQRGPG